MSANPYLQTDGSGTAWCILCDLFIANNDKRAIYSAAFDSIKKNANLWSRIDKRVCVEHPYKAFLEASLRQGESRKLMILPKKVDAEVFS